MLSDIKTGSKLLTTFAVALLLTLFLGSWRRGPSEHNAGDAALRAASTAGFS